MPRKLGNQTLRVLGCLLHEDKTSLEIARELGIPVTGIYTMLARYVDAGFLRGYYRKEDLERRHGRARRYYAVTGMGESAFRTAGVLLGGAK